MPTIEVDFETYKAITARRASESIKPGDVVRAALGLGAPASISPAPAAPKIWLNDGVSFRVGARLRHRFRDNRVVEARITEGGVDFAGQIYGDLSPAAGAASGNTENGWRFWEVEESQGRWVKAADLRLSAPAPDHRAERPGQRIVARFAQLGLVEPLAGPPQSAGRPATF